MSSSTFSGLIEKVSFANKWPVLLKATSDDDQPTPGYLFQEINELTLISGSFCQDLLDCLNERVNNRSCHVKIKALKILKFVVENGHPEFRHGLRKKSKAVVEATKHGGPPDPIHGNSPYVMVRHQAKELCQMLFEVEETDAVVPQVKSVKMISTGGIGSGSSHAGGMQGFGNTPHSSSSDNILSSLKDLADKVLEPSDQALPPKSLISMGAYDPVTNDAERPVAEVVKKLENRPVRPKVKAHTPGKAGGGWEEEEEEVRSRRRLINRVEATMVADWSTERRIVNNLVLNKESILPKRQDLRDFILCCSSANCDKVVEFVNKALDSEKSSILMRAMLAVESLLATDLVPPEKLTDVCFPHLLAIYQEQNGQIQHKARKILRILEKFSSDAERFRVLPARKTAEKNPEDTKSLSDSTQSFPLARTLSDSPEIPAFNVPFVSNCNQPLHTAHDHSAQNSSSQESSDFPFLYSS